jgi:molybdopterin-containing oxidoreductase family molybdopterin binding subunit
VSNLGVSDSGVTDADPTRSGATVSWPTPGVPPGTEPDRVVRTVCSPNCEACCGVNAFVRDDRIYKLEPAAFPEEHHRRICLRGIAMAVQRLHHPDRLTHPLKRVGARGEGKWQRVSWDEALDDIAARLARTAAEHGSAANAWMTMTGNYGFKSMTASARIANSLRGTLFTNHGMMGDLAAMMGYLPTLGVPTVANEHSDLPHARYVLVLGRNPADTAHSEMHYLFDALENGARLCVVDPRFSRSAAKADEWVGLRPGTDAAFVIGLLNVLVAEERIDADYVRRHTNAPFLVRPDGRLLRWGELGAEVRLVFDSAPAAAAVATGGETDAADPSDFVVWSAVLDAPVPSRGAAAAQAALGGTHTLALADGTAATCRTAWDRMLDVWAPYTPEHVAAICEIPAEQVRRVARDYASTNPAWIWLGAGLQRYHHGHLAHRSAITLAALTGNIGKDYAGANCIDGALFQLWYFAPEQWLAPGGRTGTRLPGTRMLETIASGSPQRIKSLWLQAYGFGTQAPNFDRFVREALPQLDLFVVTEQVMTGAAEYADYVLPCVSYFEDDEELVAGATDWYLQLRRRAVPPVGESRNDYEIFGAIAARLGQGEHWSMSAREVWRFVLDEHRNPLFASVDTATLERDGVVAIDIRRPHTPFKDLRFPTPSGRIELYTEQLLPFGEEVLLFREQLEGTRSTKAATYPFTLMSHKHVHTAHSQHTGLPWIRELLPEPRLEIAPGDAAGRGIADGDWVRVWNDRGRMVVRALVNPGIKSGTLAIPQGWWRKHFREGHYAELGHVVPNPAQDAIIETNYPVWDVLVDVRKEEGA